MSWVHPLAAGTDGSVELLGGKAHGLCVLLRLGLPVPRGFVIDTRACRVFLRDGALPAGLDVELAEAARGLTTVSVRSGAAVSMPGMMSTVLNVDLAR